MNEQNNQPTNQQNPVPNWNVPTANPPWWLNPWMLYGHPNQPRPGNMPNPWAAMMQPPGQQSTIPQEQSQQPAQEPSKTNTVPCGIISSESDITPADVPMNGGFGMFMQKDLSAIYIKQWQSDGKIYTKKYIEDFSESPAESVDPVNARFERIEDTLTKVVDMLTGMNIPKTSSSKKKLEVSADGE